MRLELSVVSLDDHLALGSHWILVIQFKSEGEVFYRVLVRLELGRCSLLEAVHSVADQKGSPGFSCFAFIPCVSTCHVCPKARTVSIFIRNRPFVLLPVRSLYQTSMEVVSMLRPHVFTIVICQEQLLVHELHPVAACLLISLIRDSPFSDHGEVALRCGVRVSSCCSVLRHPDQAPRIYRHTILHGLLH